MFGVWCNGNTADSGPAFPGSSPGTPTTQSPSGSNDAWRLFFCWQLWFPAVSSAETIGFSHGTHWVRPRHPWVSSAAPNGFLGSTHWPLRQHPNVKNHAVLTAIRAIFAVFPSFFAVFPSFLADFSSFFAAFFPFFAPFSSFFTAFCQVSIILSYHLSFYTTL